MAHLHLSITHHSPLKPFIINLILLVYFSHLSNLNSIGHNELDLFGMHLSFYYLIQIEIIRRQYTIVIYIKINLYNCFIDTLRLGQ